VRDRYPNPWGLHDTAGNVWEWVEDRYAPYSADPARDPSGPDEGVSRVLRGGSWSNNPGYCRAANRVDLAPDDRYDLIGFRVCRGAPIEPLGAAPLNTVPLPR
jgi:sulfatase modifying factor 1